MSYKEKRQPVERKEIKHGKHKGLTDMSFDLSRVKVPEGGVIDVRELIELVHQEKLPTPRKRDTGSR